MSTEERHVIAKQYLGDGAYADFDGWSVVLTTENGLTETNRIVMEPEVTTAFLRWLERLSPGWIARLQAGGS